MFRGLNYPMFVDNLVCYFSLKPNARKLTKLSTLHLVLYRTIKQPNGQSENQNLLAKVNIVVLPN
ncbi:hypothetical protein DHW03_05975 [Pedobacter yonginense]|uniref:Uncharacterized protein n=1 Tax=Pedobacter yonginense TaxID=651869 RepID=A0A317ESG3_9SPHI|nr:hypothetical protein DHW03_05975 [Pedobacter yonginense]